MIFPSRWSFVNKVGGLAEKEGHHPDIKIVYNRSTLELITHVIVGLFRKRFHSGGKN